MATSSSLRSPCERPPARVRAWASSRKSASTSVASCHTGRSASASDSSRRVLPLREKMASATLSSALSWSKRLTSWNERAIPARIRSLTGCFVTSWPRKRMWPSSAVSSPLIRLTSVVLPAPLEPMRASTSPSCTRKSTRSTARNSPNCFTTAFVSSSTLIDRRGGPRYGPPASSSEGGYAPLGLPRPSLGRAPAQPWRASGLTQNVSSLHHVVRQRADARHGDGHAILGRQREARFGHEPGARQQIGAGRKQVVADEPGGEVVERAAHAGGRDLALVRDGAAALDHDGDVEDGRLLVVGQPHHGAQRARLAVDLGLRQVQRIFALDVARRDVVAHRVAGDLAVGGDEHGDLRLGNVPGRV